MSNFRIDKFVATHIADAEYAVSAVLNSDKPLNTATGTTATNNLSIEYPLSPYDPSQGYNLQPTAVNFSQLNKYQITDVYIHEAGTPANRRRKGGVVIINTDYPPPSASQRLVTTNQAISADFTIKKTTITRKTASDLQLNFRIDIDLSYTSSTFEYSEPVANLIYDNVHSDPATGSYVYIICIEFTCTPTTTQNSNTFSLTNIPAVAPASLELERYNEGGVPIIIKDKNQGLVDVGTKMGVIRVV